MAFFSVYVFFFFFKQKTAYEMRISDWSSDVCSSDLANRAVGHNIARCALRADKDHSASKHSLGSKSKRSRSHLVFSLLYGQGFPVRWRNGRVKNRSGRTACPA